MSSTYIVEKKSIWNLKIVGDFAGETQNYSISSLNSIVGRAPNVALRLSSPRVSKQHAMISVREEKLHVADLSSTNGTFVNGDRIMVETELRRDDLLQFGDVAFRVYQDITDVVPTLNSDAHDDALALTQFDRLMSERAVIVHYQPIVTADGARTIAFEVLGRSRLYGLSTPRVMFRIASQLNLEAELSRMFRSASILENSQIGPPHVFLNTHPNELQEVESLILSLRELRNISPKQQITLEIHESAVAYQRAMEILHAELKQLKIGLAYDDFGAGQSRLVELANVTPDYVKFDMALVQGISEATTQKQTMIASLVRMTRDLGAIPLAEGIETFEDGSVCRQLGFELLQGFYYGKPLLPEEYLKPT